MSYLLKHLHHNRKLLLKLILILGVLFGIPSFAYSWPTNHLDSSATGNKPYCTSCHSYKTGYISLEKINNQTPMTASITTNRNDSFTLDFRTIGLGYGRFTVAGAVQVPDTTKWYLSTKSGSNVPWFIGKQDTNFDAPVDSPFMWVTDFSENDNPNAQKGVTLDDGTGPPATFTDRNSLAHDEAFSVNVFVYDSVPYGNYTLKLWGIGTASNGVLGYNEKIINVNVFNDTTSPSAAVFQAFDGITSSTINVKWTGAADGETGVNGYELYRSTNSSGPFTYVGYANYPATSYTDRELLAGTTYYYKINAVDNAGNTQWSGSTGSAATDSGARVDAAVPAAPTGLSAFLITNPEDNSKKIVKLNWNANTEGDVVGYYLYRATSATGSYAPLTESVINSINTDTLNVDQNIVMNTVYYVDNQVRYGTTYYYKVLAVDAEGGVSTLSTYVTATPAVDVGEPNPHGNYKSRNGMCQNCHSLHSANGKELVFNNSITDTCYSCHDGSQSKFNTKAAFDTTNNPSHHKIPEGRYSCNVCHNPHNNPVTNPRLLAVKSNEDGQIKRSGNQVCWGCHGQNSTLQNPFGRDHHTPFLKSKHNSLNTSSQITGIVCRNCHVPHGSANYPLLVAANSDNFCISCHKNLGFTKTQVYRDPMVGDPDPVYGQVFASVYLNNFSNDYIGTQHDKNFYSRNTCTMCHEPHGSTTNRYMLSYPYRDYWTTSNVSGKIVGPIDYSNPEELNLICFRCHDSQYYVGINGDYTKVTVGSRFGNGNAKNYHNHTAKLKISCRTCHDPHSGKSALHNTAKPAGFEWNLNNDSYINFDWDIQVGIATYSSYNNRLAFIPQTDANFNISGYSCAIKCHQKDHSIGSGKYLSYSRTVTTPAVTCNGCHDYDAFDSNSRHPVLGPISTGGNTVACDQCHFADHSKHNKTNPYGLKDTIVTNWVYNGSPQTITTTLPMTYDLVTGKEIPAYKEFCWQCHGSTSGRQILGDHKTKFLDKPHSLLERSGKDNPYATGQDIPCLTCHANHSSSNMRLLRKVIDGVSIDAESNTGKINVCLACHDGSPAPMDIKSKYNAASSGGHFIKADKNKKLLCIECHDSHGTTNKLYLLDKSNKYQTGITFEGNHTGAGVRWFCLACHPLNGDPGRPQQVYNTVYTVGAGEVIINQLPSTVQDHVYGNSNGRDCAICHDPHKPWPATGGEDKCYNCHSRPNGEATDIKSLMGLTSQPGSGLLSHHPIADGMTINNTCTTNCHLPHPHAERATHLQQKNLLESDKNKWEKELCFSCHDNTITPAKSPYTLDRAKFDGKKHDYTKLIRIYPADDSAFYGVCDKCHIPHGSNFKPMLRNRKDLLCLGCHNGVTTDKNGAAIKDIKTMYDRSGHKYKNNPTAKLYCDECHIPHGSTNDKYLRDSAEHAPRQTITFVGETTYTVNFPDNLTLTNYKTRLFCTTCHKEYVAGVSSYVYYSSETTPGGQVNISNLPLIGPHGVQINEHKAGQTKNCTECHNPHDPDPVGNNKDCFICHGVNNGVPGFAYQIQPLTGLNGVWPAGYTPKVSFHPIKDASTANFNDCMNMCHVKHTHNPRANLIKDKRAFVKDITAPVGPTLSAVASSANRIDVRVFAPTSTDVVGYNIFRSTDNTNWSKYAVVYSRITSPASLWFYDGGLAVNQQFYYKVQAFDRKGNLSAFSPVVSATTSAAADTTSPDIPLNVSVDLPTRSDMKSSSTVLSWSPSKDNYELRKYNVYRATANPDDLASYTLVGSTGVTSFNDGLLTENTTYYYRVTAVDSLGNESAKSAWVSVKTNLANTAVKAGSYYYRDGAETIAMVVYRPEDTSQTPTNLFMNGAQIKVQLTTPKLYFGRALNHWRDIKLAKLTFYSNSNLAGTNLSLTEESDGTNDIYSWSGQVPSTGSIYQLTVDMKVYDYVYEGVTYYGSKKILSKEAITVTPTTRIMKTYSDSGRTIESLMFKPGDIVYITAPSLYSNGNYYPAFLGMYAYNGTQIGAWNTDFYQPRLLTDGNYDQNTGLLKYSYTLPTSGLTNDSWYSVGAYGGGYWGTVFTDIFQQILVRSPDTTAPNAPSALAVNVADQNKVSLTWTGSSSTDVTGYRVYRKKSADSSYIPAGTTGPDILNYDVTGLEPGATYNFYVKAFDAVSNISAASNTVTQATTAEPADAEAPNKPVGVRLVVNSSTSITVLWDANSLLEKVSDYSVYRSQDDINYYKLGTTGITSFTDNNLYDNTNYYYKVLAHDKAGNTSVFSASVNKVTKSSGDSSIEGALCMSCHDGVTSPPLGYTVSHKIGTAFNKSKHNVDFDLITFKDGSIYRGNCTKCHVPHGSDYVHLLRQQNNTSLCFICHENATESGKYGGKRNFELSAHGLTSSVGVKSSTPRYWPGGTGVDSTVPAKAPEDAGKCFNCHAPHGRYDPTTGQYIKSSAWAGDGTILNRLCFTCHSDDPTRFFGEWNGKTVYSTTAHGDATKNAKMKLTDNLGVEWGAGECANCHDPHGSKNPAMLRYPVNEDGPNKNKLCLQCHDKANILQDTGLFDGSEVYTKSKHGMYAQWLEGFNTGGVIYNKTTFLPGVCLNCHNSHGKTTDNSADASKVNKKMLVIQDGPGNEICNKCHEYPDIKANLSGYGGSSMFNLSAHKGSSRPGALWPGGTYYPEPGTEEIRGKCINCHDPHGTAKRDWYGNIISINGATFDEEEEMCYTCHKAGAAGMPAIYDMAQFKGRMTGHMPWMTVNVHSFGEDLNSKPRHVECQDCHNVHMVESTYGITDMDVRLPKVLKGTWGIKITSWPTPNTPNINDTSAGGWKEKPVETDPSKYPYQIVNSDDPQFEEYMLCFKCHASYASQSGGKRVVAFLNPKNTSSHGFRPESNPTNFLNKAMSMTVDGKPVADYLFTPGSPFNPNPDINVLGEPRRFKVTCSDCHGNSDTNGPKGPHGSNFDYLLKKNPKDVTFCTTCHNAKAYNLNEPLYNQYSFFNEWHSHNFISLTWGTQKDQGNADFAQYFGTNQCRMCHFAGAYKGDTQYISTHGENASTKVAVNYYGTTTYTSYRGLNGFFLKGVEIPGDGQAGYSTCRVSDSEMSCGAH